MDTVGLLLIVASVIAYFATRKNNPKVASFALFALGVGVGITGAAWYMAFVIIPSL